ncbi:hypothetical protein [Butyrivibrio sp. MC2013]|uniref:hypothetical protein n=1 Tax=Butyrivibrio sp. MC2013 TaxID=1280686 RepID=UPI0018C8E59A|nr:hypothetical protein [Butyrivibrio sp. MC2013]
MAVKGLGVLDNSNIYRLAFFGGWLLIAAKLLLEEHSLMEMIYIAVLLIAGLISWRVAGNQGTIMTMMMIVAVKNMDMKKVFRAAAVTWSLTFAIQIVTQLLWLRPRDFVIHAKLGLGYVIRWGLGYAHPNVLQIMYMIIVICIIMAVNPTRKALPKYLLIASFGALFVFIYSVSITGILFHIAFVILALYFRYRSGGERELLLVEKIILYLLTPSAVVVSVAGPLLLKGRAFELFDKLLTTRMTLSRYFLTGYRQTPFGQDFSYLYHSLNLDCSYVNLLMKGGIIPFAIVVIIYLLAFDHMMKAYQSGDDERAWVKLAAFLAIVFAGMAEPFLFNNSFKNMSLLLVGEAMYQMMGERSSDILWKGRKIEVRLPYISPCGYLGSCRNFLISYGKAVMIAAVCAGICGGAIYAGTANMPDKIYARQWMCSAEDHESLFFDEEEIEQLRLDDKVWVLNYMDEEDPMQEFDGQIIRIEYYRGILASMVLISMAAAIVITMVCSLCISKPRGR